MSKIQVNNTAALGQVIGQEQVAALRPAAEAAALKLEQGTGLGNDFLGWMHLPSSITPDFLNDIEATAQSLRSKCQYVVTIGIGGSYLGAKAVIEALADNFAAYKPATTHVLFAGNNIGEDYLYDLIDLLKDMLEQQVGKAEAATRIVAVTDARRGALRGLATQEGYKTYVIPDNVGGRFSVLTPVGLLPIAVAGYDIKALVEGAVEMEKAGNDDIFTYATTRNALYRAGRKIELLVNFNPKLHYFAEWWKQLYGESEGKDHKGIFPAACDFTTDLHSMGQWIQDGERTIYETVISVGEPAHSVVIPDDKANLDGLNFIAGKHVDYVNKMAELGTRLAHVDGGVPNLLITVPALKEKYLGQLIYFFEKACGVSGYILDVNPFNQPGVEAYKKNMFALLDKPGYEAESKAIKAKLGK